MKDKEHAPKEGQRKAQVKELNKMEESNVPNMEFKAMLIRILMELKGRMDKFSENFNKETVSIKKEHRALAGVA